MQNRLDVNLHYLKHITEAMDKVMAKDDGRLALDTKERRDQEKYFGEGKEPEEDETEES